MVRFLSGVVVAGVLLLSGCDVGTRSDESESETPTTRCVDVTSYDGNWQNDMKCTRPDGTIFYTDYEGARAYE